MTPQQIIKTLNMSPHPEGGWYVETWRSDITSDGRAVGTAIYFLLEADQTSHWHRVDADEMWHWYAGHPLDLSIDQDTYTLGPDILSSQRPQILVPKDAWQAAKPIGGWVLVGCTVSPGFEFAGFELAPKGGSPHGS